MRVVGILLVSSLMTLPVAAAIRFARGFKQMFIYSVLFSQISVLSGLMAAFQLDIAPGGTIVLIAVIQLAQLTNEYQKYYDTILAELNRMNAIIEDFLSVSRRKMERKLQSPVEILQSLVVLVGGDRKSVV